MAKDRPKALDSLRPLQDRLLALLTFLVSMSHICPPQAPVGGRLVAMAFLSATRRQASRSELEESGPVRYSSYRLLRVPSCRFDNGEATQVDVATTVACTRPRFPPHTHTYTQKRYKAHLLWLTAPKRNVNELERPIWFIIKGDPARGQALESRGPLTVNELRVLYADGEISGQTM